MADTLKVIFDGIAAADTKKVAKGYEDTAIILTNGQSKIVRDEMDAEQTMFSALSDIKATVLRTWTKNDIEVVEWELSGKNTGDMGDTKATGRPVALRVLDYFDVSDGNLVQEQHRYVDRTTLAKQLDSSAAPGSFPSASFTPPGSVGAHVAKGSPDEDKNAVAMKSWYTLMNAHKTGIYDLIGDDMVLDEVGSPQQIKGLSDVRNRFWYLLKVIPDLVEDFSPPLAFEDFTFSEVVIRGTQKGTLGGIPPTGNPIKLHQADLMQWKGGKMVAAWTYSDFTEVRDELLPKKKPDAGGAAPSR